MTQLHRKKSSCHRRYVVGCHARANGRLITDNICDQIHAIPFYEKLGYKAVGEQYDEDGGRCCLTGAKWEQAAKMHLLCPTYSYRTPSTHDQAHYSTVLGNALLRGLLVKPKWQAIKGPDPYLGSDIDVPLLCYIHLWSVHP